MSKTLPAVWLRWMPWRRRFPEAVGQTPDQWRKDEAAPDSRVGGGLLLQNLLGYRLVY